ncbi:MAG: ion channel [Thiobacillaceae bacterium]|jgi:voltage-gated potassium channel
MPLNIRLALGLAGVPPNDTPKSQQWEKRLHWPVVIATLLAIPAFYLTELSGEVHLRELGRAMDAIVLLTFALELAIMLAACRQKKRYLIYNWLTVAIVLATGISVLLPQLPGELTALFRLMRLAIVSLLVAQIAHSFRAITPGSTPYILMIGFGLMLLAGGGFYLLEPTVQTYWDGVWLAFTSGLTVGYGDIVPTTGPSRLFAGVVIVLTYGVMSLVTASIAAFFVGKEDAVLRREMHQDLKALRIEVQQLRRTVENATKGSDSGH